MDLALHCSATRSTAVLIDGEKLVDVIHTGPCAFSLHLPDFEEQFGQRLDVICAAFGLLPNEIKNFRLICVSMSGCKTDLHRSRINSAIRRSRIAADQLIVCEDAVAEMHAHGLSQGMLIMVATGVNIYFLGEMEFSVGSWGSEVSDSGGGYALGRAAIRKVLDYIDGREVVSAQFASRVCKEINVQSPKAIGSWYESLRTTPEWRKTISGLARIVIQMAEQSKDFTALQLVHSASSEILKSTVAGLRKVRLESLDRDLEILITGGLILNSEILLQAVVDATRDFHFGNKGLDPVKVRVKTGRRPAVVGTVGIAITGDTNRCLANEKLETYTDFVEGKRLDNE